MLLPPCLSGFKKLQQSSDRTEWLIPRTEWHVYLLCLRSGWRLPFLDCGMVPIIHTLRVPRSPGAPVCPRVSKGGIHAFPHWLRGLYRAPWRKLTMVAVPGKIGSIVPSSLGVDSLRCICREWWCCFWRWWWAERGFPGGTSGKEPTCQCRRCKMCVRSLGWEDPLEEDLATHSSILTWRSQWTEEPGRLQSTGLKRVGHDWSNLACMHTCGGRGVRGGVTSSQSLQLFLPLWLFALPWATLTNSSKFLSLHRAFLCIVVMAKLGSWTRSFPLKLWVEGGKWGMK